MKKRNLIFQIIISAFMFLCLLTMFFHYFSVKDVDVVEALSDNFEILDIDVEAYEDDEEVEEIISPRAGITVIGDLYDINSKNMKHVGRLKKFSITMLIVSWVLAAATIVCVWALKNRLRYIVTVSTSFLSFASMLSLLIFVPNIASHALVEAIEKNILDDSGLLNVLFGSYVRDVVLDGLKNFTRDLLRKSLDFGYWMFLICAVCALAAAIVGLVFACREKATAVVKSVAKLMGLSGEYEGADIEIGNGIIIGRDASVCQLVIKKDKISRKHCKIEYNEQTGKYLVTDYSSNGTYMLDGKRLDENVPVELERGSIIRLGVKGDTFRLG